MEEVKIEDLAYYVVVGTKKNNEPVLLLSPNISYQKMAELLARASSTLDAHIIKASITEVLAQHGESEKST